MRSTVVTSVLCWCVPSTCTKASVFTLWPLCLPFPVPLLDPRTTQAPLVWFRQLCTLWWYNWCCCTVSPVESSPSCWAVTYWYSRQSRLHCHRRIPPHPARSHLHRCPHPRSGNPRDREGWAGQANTQWLLNQTSSSLGSKLGRTALGFSLSCWWESLYRVWSKVQ